MTNTGVTFVGTAATPCAATGARGVQRLPSALLIRASKAKHNSCVLGRGMAGAGAVYLAIHLALLPGCSLTMLDYTECTQDVQCQSTLGEAFLCSGDGFCRELPDQPGECEGEIQVRLLGARSGPLADVGEPYFKGEFDLIRQINEEGGVRGCPIAAQFEDYAYDPTQAYAAYEAWAAAPEWDDVVTVFGFGTRDTLDLSPELAQQGVVVISASYSGDVASPTAIELGIDVPGVSDNFEAITESVPKVSPGYPFNFFAGTDYSTGARVAMEFANKEGARKVAFFACSNAYCQSPLAAIKTYAQDDLGLALGRDLVVELDWTREEVEDAVRTFFEEELAHAKLDSEYVVPDWVWVGNNTTTAGQIGRTIGLVREQSGLDIRVISNNWGFDENIDAACEGGCVGFFHGIMPFAAYGDNVPGMQRLEEVHDRWRAADANGWMGAAPEVDAQGNALAHRNVRYVQGYVSVLLWQTAMERLIDYRKAITGRELKNVLETFDNVNMLGLTPPLSFSPDDHRPQSTEKIYHVAEDGSLENIPPDAAVFLRDEWLGW